MRVITLDTDGIRNAHPVITQVSRHRFTWAFIQGPLGYLSEGKVWIYRFPLHTDDFPPDSFTEPTGPFKLEPMRNGRTHSHYDHHSNRLFLLRHQNEDDGSFLVLWTLSRFPVSNATYAIYGEVEELGKATASDNFNYDAEYPVVHVTGPATLYWYVGEHQFVATFDGENWKFEQEK